MKSQSLIPLINIPTRVCPSSATCIDNIFTNSLVPVTSGVISLPLADHFPIFCCVPFVNSADQDKIRVKFGDFSSDNLNKLKIDVSQVLENFDVFNSLPVEQQFEIFDGILFKCFDSRCPIKCKAISVKRFKCPWMSNALHNSIKEKHRLYKLSLSDMNYLPIYKRYRNIFTNALRKSKSIHYSNKFKSCSRDAKSTWKVINSLLHGR